MLQAAVRIQKLDERAILPTYGSAGAAGADLYALAEGGVTIRPGETKLIHTGLAIELPEGYVGLVFARSGLAVKRGAAPANKVGVVDFDYRGELIIALHNHATQPIEIDDGERVAQLVIVPFLRAEFLPAASLSDTARGENGFGSTGRK